MICDFSACNDGGNKWLVVAKIHAILCNTVCYIRNEREKNANE